MHRGFGWPNPPAEARYTENFPSDAIVNAPFRPGTATRITTDASKSGNSRPTLNRMIRRLTARQPRHRLRRKHRTATDPRRDAGYGAGRRSGSFRNAGVLRARGQQRLRAGSADHRSRMRSRPHQPLLASSHMPADPNASRQFLAGREPAPTTWSIRHPATARALCGRVSRDMVTVT